MNIKERLLSLPSEIEELKLNLIEKQNNLQMLQEKMKFWSLYELDLISNEVDEKGKPKYSNDTKRQAELQRRKDESDEYGALEIEAEKLEKEVAILNIKLDKLYNEQSNLRAICRLEGRD